MEADLLAQMGRNHLAPMEQQSRHVLMRINLVVLMVHSLHALMAQPQGDQAVLMDPHPLHALMEQL